MEGLKYLTLPKGPVLTKEKYEARASQKALRTSSEREAVKSPLKGKKEEDEEDAEGEEELM